MNVVCLLMALATLWLAACSNLGAPQKLVLSEPELQRLPPEKLAQLDRAGVQPAALLVTRSGLEITFAPRALP